MQTDGVAAEERRARGDSVPFQSLYTAGQIWTQEDGEGPPLVSRIVQLTGLRLELVGEEYRFAPPSVGDVG